MRRTVHGRLLASSAPAWDGGADDDDDHVSDTRNYSYFIDNENPTSFSTGLMVQLSIFNPS